eukprot:scaffold63828_cov54-Phaeocystis_antarctica.AAC.2
MVNASRRVGARARAAHLVVRPHGAREVVVVAVAPRADAGTLEREAQHDGEAAEHFRVNSAAVLLAVRARRYRESKARLC